MYFHFGMFFLNVTPNIHTHTHTKAQQNSIACMMKFFLRNRPCWMNFSFRIFFSVLEIYMFVFFILLAWFMCMRDKSSMVVVSQNTTLKLPNPNWTYRYKDGFGGEGGNGLFLQIYHWRNLFTPALLGRGNYNPVILSCLFAQLIAVKKKVRQLQDYTSISLINLSLSSINWIDCRTKIIFWFATVQFFPTVEATSLTPLK